MSPEQNLTTFKEYIDQQYGIMGSPGRQEYERGFEIFMVGVNIAQARENVGLTVEQLAKK